MRDRCKTSGNPLFLPLDDSNHKTLDPEHHYFFKLPTIHQQISALHSIIKLKSGSREGYLNFLCIVYIASNTTPTAALRRISYGGLREMSPGEVSLVMHGRLMLLCVLDSAQCFSFPDECSSQENDQLEHLKSCLELSGSELIDVIALLSAWQPHGIEALYVDSCRILSHLVAALHWIKNLSTCGAQERERGYNCASKVARAAAAMARNWSVLGKPTLQSRSYDFLKTIASDLESLLVDDSTILPCRLACGVSLPELLRLIDSNRSLSSAPKSANFVYEKYRSKLSSRPLAHVCFINGVINITDLASISKKKDVSSSPGQDLLTYESLLTELDQLGLQKELQREAPFALTCVRTILQWTEKLSGAIRVNKDCENLLERRVDDLTRISFYYIEHFVDAVQHQGKALFKSIVDLLSNGGSANKSEYLSKSFATLLSEPHHRKAKYSPLQALSKHVKVCSLITAEDVMGVYKTLCEKSMLPYVKDFVRDVGGKFLHESPDAWTLVWADPYFQLLDQGFISPSTLESLLPELLKLVPSLADRVIDLCGNQSEKYIMLGLNALRSERILQRPELLWRAQWATEDRVRENLLRLLTDCPRTCEPVDIVVTHHLQTFVELNLSTQNPALRQSMFSAFKKLLWRIHDSGVYWRRADKQHGSPLPVDLDATLRLVESVLTIIH